MSATGGAGGMGGMAGLNDLIGGWLRGGQAGGTIVGQENPEWDFPLGQDRVPDSVRSLLLRGDAGPTGINQFIAQELQKNPKLIDEIRSAINMGVLRPKNAAAQNITTGYGGYRAGDVTALGPLINGMPSGLNESQLNTLANILNTAAEYQLGLIEATGYFEGKPTWQVQKEKEELAQGWKDRATNEFIAMETQRGNMANEELKGEELTNQNIQKMAELFGGQMVTGADGQQTWAPTEAAQEFATTQSGYLNGQATLTREQQAFNQAKDVANLASNPRNYIEAQMLANSRGGLNGMAPNNQVQQTTFGPATTAGQQFQVPGGQNNQMQNWQTMLGNNVAQRSAATSAYGSPNGPPAPNNQAATQPPQAPGDDMVHAFGGQPGVPGGPENPGEQPLDLSNPKTWAGYAQDANQRWTGAQQGMAGGLNNNPAWSNLVSSQQNYQQGGTTPGWQTPSNGSTMEREMNVVDDSNWTPEQRAQWEEQSRQASQAAQQERMRLMQQGGIPGGMQGLPNWSGQAGVGTPALTPGQPDEQMSDIRMGMPAQRPGELLTKPMPGMGQDGASISPFNPATGLRFDENTGQYTSAPLPTAQQNIKERTALMGPQRPEGGPGMQPVDANGQRQTAFQAPNQGQDVAAANQGFQLPTSNFTQSLLQNRVVPKTGGLNTAGKMVSGQQFQNSFNPQKVRPQDYLRGTNSQQQGFNAAGSYGGFSDQDLTGIMRSNLPSFKAPTAGKMI